MRYYITFLAIALLVGCGTSQHLGVNEIHLEISNAQIARYQVVEIQTQFVADWRDPYDSKDVMTDLKITTPSGKQQILPGYYQSGDSGQTSQWLFKFAPKESGEYTISAVAFDDGRLIGESPLLSFRSKDSQNKGFVETHDLWSFKFSNGELFRGIGENFGWEARDEDDSKFFSKLHEDKRFNYENMLQKLNTNGANVFRTWMIYWNLPVDWKTVHNASRYSNVSTRFNESGIQRMDDLVALTEKHEMKMILSLDSHAGFDDFAWPMNTYSQDSGGPAKTPKDFFVNPEAKQRYKDKLRFMVANWSYSSGILAWEFFNEIDNIMYNGHDRKITDDAIVQWHQEMSQYLAAIDPHDHLITTSISHREVNGLFDIEHIDFNQSHLYKVTKDIPTIINKFVSAHNKPYFAGEFSAEWDWSKNFDDIEDAMISDFKRGLWFGLFSPTPILPLSWWWEYFDNNNADTYFAHVQNINQMMLKDGGISQMNWPYKTNGLTEYAVQSENKVYVYLYNDNKHPIEWENKSNLAISTVYNCNDGMSRQLTNQTLTLIPNEDVVLIFDK